MNKKCTVVINITLCLMDNIKGVPGTFSLELNHHLWGTVYLLKSSTWSEVYLQCSFCKLNKM